MTDDRKLLESAPSAGAIKIAINSAVGAYPNRRMLARAIDNFVSTQVAKALSKQVLALSDEQVVARADVRAVLGATPTERPMSSVPLDGTHVLLHTTCHGWVEAWFAPGEWSDETPDCPREYSGAAWVCADDAFQVEVEETPEGMIHGTAVGWLPCPHSASPLAAAEKMTR